MDNYQRSYDENILNAAVEKYLPILIGGGKFDDIDPEKQVEAAKELIADMFGASRTFGPRQVSNGINQIDAKRAKAQKAAGECPSCL